MLRLLLTGMVVMAGLVLGMVERAWSPSAWAQAPVPTAALRGQNATPEPPRLSAQAAMQADLARLHHAAQREVQLGDLAATGGDAAHVRTYGAQLASRFRSLDELILGAAAARDVSEARLAAMFAGENLEGARREAAALSRLGASHGTSFDASFWVAVAEEQSAAADLSGALGAAARDPAIRELASTLSGELDEASRDAVQAAKTGAPPPAR